MPGPVEMPGRNRELLRGCRARLLGLPGEEGVEPLVRGTDQVVPRRAHRIETEHLSLTVTVEGGHIAEVVEGDGLAEPGTKVHVLLRAASDEALDARMQALLLGIGVARGAGRPQGRHGGLDVQLDRRRRA